MKHYLYNTISEEWEVVSPADFPGAEWENTTDFFGNPCMIAYNTTVDGSVI